MTQTSDRATASNEASAASSEHIRQLHKMSRTAGLGNDSYVAVNGLAVATLVFGLGSALVVMNAVFLIVPVAAIVLGMLALYQIRHSNGTQTGAALSWTGIAVAIVFTGLLGTRQITQIVSTRQEEQAIADEISAFGSDVSAKNYDAAYARFSDQFKGWQSKAMFVDRMNAVQGAYGSIKSMAWNGRAVFDHAGATGQPTAVSVAVIQFEKAGESGVGREEIRFIKRSGKWQLDTIPKYFPPEVKYENSAAGPGKSAPGVEPGFRCEPAESGAPSSCCAL